LKSLDSGKRKKFVEGMDDYPDLPVGPSSEAQADIVIADSCSDSLKPSSASTPTASTFAGEER